MNHYSDKQIEIIHVAEKLFALDGFDGTSVRKIAAKANVNVAMISYYFGSKERLLESIVIYRINGLRLQLENLIAEDLSPIEKVNTTSNKLFQILTFIKLFKMKFQIINENLI